MTTSSDQHRDRATEVMQTITCAIVTASDTRTPETDTSGQTIQKLLEEAGHEVVAYHIVKDEAGLMADLLDMLTAREHPPRIILFNGGTGVAPRDRRRLAHAVQSDILACYTVSHNRRHPGQSGKLGVNPTR